MTQYRVLSLHPETVKVGSASPTLEPGEFVELDETDVKTLHNQTLIKEGLLMDVDEFIKANKANKVEEVKDSGKTGN